MKKVISILKVVFLNVAIFSFFSCSEKLTQPEVVTLPVSGISSTSAESGGAVTNEGGAPIAGRGVCWSTSIDPTITNNKTTELGSFGVFTSKMAQLNPNTKYYVRAYAVNSVGTGYGNLITFSTGPVAIPAITTTGLTSVAQTSAISGGNISNDNGGAVTSCGVCWSTVSTPTKELSTKTVDSTSKGSFVSTITQLIPNTLYYLRAYATNSAGTGYGNQLTFTTLQVAAPSLTTTVITSVTLTNAVSGGNVTSDYGGAVTIRGICWSTTPGPTTALSTKTTDGSGTGSFISNLIGLQPGLTYYVRAYATNSAGTSYGNQITFNTKIADKNGNTYFSVMIGNQVWFAENLKTTKYNDNTPIPLITDNPLPGYGWYNNDSITYKSTYGALYNWYALDAASNGGKNVCPSSWHVPSDAEWTTLTTYLGGEGFAGGKLKETGTIHWQSPNTGATNETGFTALPGGLRGLGGGYVNILGSCYFWSTTANNSTSAWSRDLSFSNNAVVREFPDKGYGCSVRCLRDF